MKLNFSHLVCSCFIGLFVLCCGGCASKKDAKALNPEYKIYVSQEYGFSVEYPKTWEESSAIPNPSVKFMALEPVEGAGDVFQENVNVVVTELTPEEKKMDDETFYQNVRMSLSSVGMTLRSDLTSMVGKYYARIIEGEMSFGTLNVYETQLEVRVGDMFYAVTVTTNDNDETKARCADAVKKIIESFKIIE